jgi:hypothetical protein
MSFAKGSHLGNTLSIHKSADKGHQNASIYRKGIREETEREDIKRLTRDCDGQQQIRELLRKSVKLITQQH